MKGSMPPSSTSFTLPISSPDAVILYHLVGLQHVGADLAAPGDILLAVVNFLGFFHPAFASRVDAAAP